MFQPALIGSELFSPQIRQDHLKMFANRKSFKWRIRFDCQHITSAAASAGEIRRSRKPDALVFVEMPPVLGRLEERKKLLILMNTP